MVDFARILYFRINVIRIDLPPLRDRGSDILLLAQHFLKQITGEIGKAVTGISPDAAERVLTYDWPGNVRELSNCMERAVALARYDQITVDDLPQKVRDYRNDRVFVIDGSPAEFPTLEEVQKRYILKTLKAAGGNRTFAARILGLDRKTLGRKLDRWSENEPSSNTGS